MNIKTIKNALEFYELHPEKFYEYMQGYVDGVSEVTNISISDDAIIEVRNDFYDRIDDLIKQRKEELPVGVWIKHEGGRNPLQGLHSSTLSYSVKTKGSGYSEDEEWNCYDLFKWEFESLNHEDRILEYKIISL